MAAYTVLWACLALLSYGIFTFAVAFRKNRRRSTYLPGPPHNKILGHGLVMNDAQQEHPPDLHPHTLPTLIQQKYDLPSVFHLDFWPFAPSALVIADPVIAQSLLHTSKSWTLSDFFRWVAGPGDIISSDGPVWKTWRSVFNPGFSASHLSTLVPQILEEGKVFCDVLEENAKENKLFRLEDVATRLTIDVIARVTVDLKLNTLREENEFATALRSQVDNLAFQTDPNPLARYSPILRAKLYYQDWKMRSFMTKALRDRFQARKAEGKGAVKRKHVIDLALETFFAEQKDGAAISDKLDPVFEQYAVTQLRAFFFAGFDTTSSTICWCLYMLEKHPEECAKVVAEHNEVFGSDPEQAEELIRQDPKLLNKLEYTLAVIKEILRLYPPASSLRETNEPITDPKTGQVYQTEGLMVWILHTAFHRNATYFPDPNAFRPCRFVQPELAQQPDHVWRPFEKGPRSCIGQELALLETKIVMVLVLRRFKVKGAYDEVMKLADDGTGWPKYKSFEASQGKVWGEEAYQTLRGSAKPRQGMPVRIEMR